jgi:hypothetical protein
VAVLGPGRAMASLVARELAQWWHPAAAELSSSLAGGHGHRLRLRSVIAAMMLGEGAPDLIGSSWRMPRSRHARS